MRIDWLWIVMVAGAVLLIAVAVAIVVWAFALTVLVMQEKLGISQWEAGAVLIIASFVFGGAGQSRRKR